MTSNHSVTRSAARRRPRHLMSTPWWRTTWAVTAVLALAYTGVSTLGASGAASAATTPSGAVAGVTADDGASVVSETVVDARMVDLSISSPALGGIGKVRLILPASWASQPTATWPSLYLLHGANEVADYTSWTKFTDVEAFMAGRDVLTVLPTDGSGGMYSAPWNYGRGGGPDYETFHTVELPQLLARGYRANATRVVAGLSIGGLGAFDYAARHPGLFKAAASYSGMLDTLMIGAPSFVTTIRVRAGLDPTALWGSTLFQRSIWNAHNPRDLAPKLVGIPLYVSSGDGSKGPFDTGLLVVDSIEPLALSSAKSFISRGNQLGLTMTTNLYKGGTHTWPYWQREFKASWPLLARGLSVPA